jgi:sigma-B regulation protein RsbU (phosphoserine phosphatase)
MISGGKVQFLRRGCTVLGVFPTLPKIEWGEIELKEDSFFFLYTDGLTDLKNDMGDYFDEEKLLEFTIDNQQLPVAQFNAKLLEHLDEFKGDLGFPDDISFLSGKIFVDKFAEK